LPVTTATLAHLSATLARQRDTMIIGLAGDGGVMKMLLKLRQSCNTSLRYGGSRVQFQELGN
jgi:hypothetical protein